MAVRAIRGATQLSVDSREEMIDAVGELVLQMLAVNEIPDDAVISFILTSTPDLVSCYPATAARVAGLDDVPLLSAQEVPVADAMPRVVRVMAHVQTSRARSQMQHVYLRGTEGLRQALGNA